MTLLSTLSGFMPLLTFLAFLHPIHVSVTEIEYDRKDQALEIMMRVFIDDLELSLRNSLREPDLDIVNPTGGRSTDDLVKAYLKDHFAVALDNQAQRTNYLGHEREAEAFIFYIEVPGVKQWNTITIKNDIIMATHDDQSNIVHVFVGDDVKSLRLTRNTPTDKLTFDNN